MNDLQRNDPRPKSAFSANVGYAGLAGLLTWTAVSWCYRLDGPYAAVVAVLSGGVPMVLWSLLVDRVHRNPTTGINWDGPPRSWREALDTGLVKLAGLWATWGIIAFFYCLERFYWQGAYLSAMRAMEMCLPALIVVSIPYVLWLERRLIEPRDGAWAFGRWLMGGAADEPEIVARLPDHFRAWTVKGFFTAFMLAGVPGNWQNVIDIDLHGIAGNPAAIANDLVAVMFMIDMCLAMVGYILTMRPLDSHIRSANPFAAGWTAALICYPPFVLMSTGGPLDYHQGELGWVRATSDHPMLQPVFALALIVLTAIYAWATMAFGLRFSNLTHRGILTHGPYRWTKHPAYLSKNAFWWIAGLPMLTTTGAWQDSARNTVIMAIVTGIYYWRARTEERHLSADPAYRDYAAWMARNRTITRGLAWVAGSRTKPQLQPQPQPPAGVPAE